MQCRKAEKMRVKIVLNENEIKIHCMSITTRKCLLFYEISQTQHKMEVIFCQACFYLEPYNKNYFPIASIRNHLLKHVSGTSELSQI